MSSVADRLKVDKAELLDPSSNNAAVRLALAETHVIAETKKYFENVRISASSPLHSLSLAPSTRSAPELISPPSLSPLSNRKEWTSPLSRPKALDHPPPSS